MLRSVLGVVVGAVLWLVGFYALAIAWVAGKIAKRRGAVWVLAGLLGVYLAAVHLVFYWPRFPWWYNLGVVIPAVPAVLLGARLANSYEDRDQRRDRS